MTGRRVGHPPIRRPSGHHGLWQVSGRNDLSRNDLIQLDYLYVTSWSLWWDLKFMFETPKTMACGTGAY